MAFKLEAYFIDQKLTAPLSKDIVQEYNKLITTLSTVPEKFVDIPLIEGTRGKISIADLIAYQIGWGKLLNGWYKAGIQGKKPEMPGEGFTTWNYTALAHHFYAKYHYSNLEEQLKTLHSTIQEILSIVEKEYKTGNLDRLGVWSWCTLQSGKQWPLSKWIQVNTAAPYKRASTLIRKAIKTIN